MSQAPFPWPSILGIWAGTFVYLLFDIYPLVKSFRATLSTWSFWLFWLVFCTLSTVAYGIVKQSVGARVNQSVPYGFEELTLVLVVIVGTIGIVQSFSIKLGDYKPVDVGRLMDGFRRQVLTDISRVYADQRNHRAAAMADKLYRRFEKDIAGLREECAGVMSFGGRTIEQIAQELEQLEKDAAAAKLSFGLFLARRIANADIERAQQLVNA